MVLNKRNQIKKISLTIRIYVENIYLDPNIIRENIKGILKEFEEECMNNVNDTSIDLPNEFEIASK